MSGWVVLGLYAAGFLLTYRRAYLALMEAEFASYSSQPDTEDRALTAAAAMLASFMWPITIVGFTIWRFATPVTPGERRAELDGRQREIERMERELHIKRD